VLTDVYHCQKSVHVLNKSHFAGDMAERDPIAAAAQRFRPIQSAMPGTTLGPIKIDAFSGGGVLTDPIGFIFRFFSACTC